MFRTISTFWKNNVLDNPKRSRKRLMAQRKKQGVLNRGSQRHDDTHRQRNERRSPFNDCDERKDRSKKPLRPIIRSKNAIPRNDDGNGRNNFSRNGKVMIPNNNQFSRNHEHGEAENQRPGVQRSFSRDSYSTITTAAETPDTHLALAKALALIRTDSSNSLPTEIFVPNEEIFRQYQVTSATNFAPQVFIESDAIEVNDSRYYQFREGLEENLFHGSVLASISQVTPLTPPMMSGSMGEEDHSYPSWLLEGGDGDLLRMNGHSSFVSDNTNTTLSTHEDDGHLLFAARLEI